MTALRDRLRPAVFAALYGPGAIREFDFTPWSDRVDSTVDALIEALGPDAARMEAALAPGTVVVTVEDVARRLCPAPPGTHELTCTRLAHDHNGYTVLDHMAQARRLLGIDGGQ